MVIQVVAIKLISKYSGKEREEENMLSIKEHILEIAHDISLTRN